MTTFGTIIDMVNTTNNGKLWTPRLSKNENVVIDRMVTRGILKRCTFLERNDAVCFTDNFKMLKGL